MIVEYPILSNKILLVVEDDLDNRMLILNLMQDHAPQTTILSATNGEQALNILRKKSVDLILLDWEMPVMNGIETLVHLQQNKQWKNIPVIMYTGTMVGNYALKQALDVGATDFLRKPADTIELFARISSILHQKEQEQKRIAAEQALSTAQQAFLEKEITLLKEDSTNNLLLLARKNEALQGIKAQCESFQKEKTPPIRTIIRTIDQLLNQDEYWADFMVKFNKMDPSFSKNLLCKHPDLSANEIRVCSLIRFGMDSKDIANLLHISASGIKKSRYRIRKKLALDANDKLDVYIMQL